ncbi:MAG: ribbon-helix-helix domain-containing protein [Vicingaceae bacterium]
MSTFTSTLPDELLAELSEQAKKLKVPKNRLIEKALSTYLNHLKRLEYIRSYQQASKDENLIAMAEEGMADYLKQLSDQDAKG